MITIPMTRAQFAEKAEQLKREQGIEITGDHGVLTKDGHSASHIFDGSALTVESLDKGFFARKIVEARMQRWLTGG